MKGVNVIIKDELINNLNEFAYHTRVGAAAYIRDSLTDATYDAFERFYCDYTPAPGGLRTSYHFKFNKPTGNPYYYERTYNVLCNGIKKYYDNKHGKIIRGGVEINPDWLEDNYGYPANLVFESIYEQGQHGPYAPWQTPIPNMNPTPQELIERSYRSLYNNVDVVVGFGVNQAKKYKYSYLRW